MPSSPPTRFCGHQRPVGPGQHVVVERVHLAERRAHLADLREQPARQGRERQESFFDVDALLAERDEEVGTRVGIDDGLERRFRLVERERRIGRHLIAAGRAEEIADDRHVGVEDLRAAHGGSIHRQRAARSARRPPRRAAPRRPAPAATAAPAWRRRPAPVPLQSSRAWPRAPPAAPRSLDAVDRSPDATPGRRSPAASRAPAPTRRADRAHKTAATTTALAIGTARIFPSPVRVGAHTDNH